MFLDKAKESGREGVVVDEVRTRYPLAAYRVRSTASSHGLATSWDPSSKTLWLFETSTRVEYLELIVQMLRLPKSLDLNIVAASDIFCPTPPLSMLRYETGPPRQACLRRQDST